MRRRPLLGRPRLARQAVQVDEALRRGAVEGVAVAVGRKAVLVERVGAPAADHREAALVELRLDLAGHALLRVGAERVEGLLQLREPQAVIDDLGPLLVDAVLELERRGVEAERLERVVHVDERERRGALVALVALDAHHAVLDHVEAAVAVLAADLVELHDERQQFHRLAVERDGLALLEADHDLLGRVRRVLRRRRHRPDVCGRLVPGVLEDAALDRAAPEVVVDRVGLGRRRRDGNAVALGPVHLLLAREEVPLAHGRQDLEAGVERVDARLEADLVVALARAAVRDVGGAGLVRDLDELLDDHRARQRREERVGVLVERVGRDRLGQDLLGVLLAHVERLGVDGSHVERLLLDPREVLGVLPHVAANRDDVEVLLGLQPLDHDRGVEAAGVGENDLLPLGGSCGRRGCRRGRGVVRLGGCGLCHFNHSHVVRPAWACSRNGLVQWRPCAPPVDRVRCRCMAEGHPAMPGAPRSVPWAVATLDLRQHALASQRDSSVLASEGEHGVVRVRCELQHVVPLPSPRRLGAGEQS